MEWMDYLPYDYRRSPPVVELQRALEQTWRGAEESGEELRGQFFLETATWGLADWEWLYGLETDREKADGLRRSVIYAKIRGKGTTTVEMIQNVSESFVNGAVAVEEHNEDYYFNIVMLSVIGIPPNMEDLRKAIDEIKPAHLNYFIIIKYNTWGMAKEGITWGKAAERTWSGMKEAAY